MTVVTATTKQEQIEVASEALKEVGEVVGTAGALVKGKKAKAILEGAAAGLGLAGSALALYNLFDPQGDPVLEGIEALKNQVANLGSSLHNALEELGEKTKHHINVGVIQEHVNTLDAYMAIVTEFGEESQKKKEDADFSNLSAVAQLQPSDVFIAMNGIKNGFTDGVAGTSVLGSAYDAYDGDYRVDLLANYDLSFLALGPTVLGAIKAAKIREQQWTNREAPPPEGDPEQVALGASATKLVQEILDAASTAIDDTMNACRDDVIPNIHGVVLGASQKYEDIWSFHEWLIAELPERYRWRAWLAFVCREPDNVNLASQPKVNDPGTTAMRHTYALSDGSRASVVLLSTPNDAVEPAEDVDDVKNRIRGIENFQHDPNWSSNTGVEAFLNAVRTNGVKTSDEQIPILIYYLPEGDISDCQVGGWGVYEPGSGGQPGSVVTPKTGYGVAIASEGSYAIDGFVPGKAPSA